MQHLTLHIANATNTFTADDMAMFRRATRKAEQFVKHTLPLDYPIDVIIAAPHAHLTTIPEDGIGGRTHHSRLITLVLDPSQYKPTEAFIYETLCHELAHSVRWEKVDDFATTLLDAMILEGLAVVYEELAMAEAGYSSSQFFLRAMQNTSQTEIKTIIAALSADFSRDTRNLDYDAIFFTGNSILPRWAGYKLGYYFVKQYMDCTDSTIRQATLAMYGAICNTLRQNDLLQ